jgi:hypothetical protein
MNTNNKTSFTAYNPEYSHDGTINEKVQSGDELRLVTMEQKIQAGERIQALIDATKEEIFND